jgi:hypothetical protein
VTERQVRAGRNVAALVIWGALAVAVAGDARAAVDAGSSARPDAVATCQTNPGPAYRNCPSHRYRVTVRASTSAVEGSYSNRGTYELVFVTDVRYQKRARRGSYAPTVALATGPGGSKLVRVSGSGTATDGSCSVRGEARPGKLFGGVAGNPSIIRRNETPRTVYYDLQLGAFTMVDIEYPPDACPLIPGAQMQFRKRLRSSDYSVSIGTGIEVSFDVRWSFHRWQRAGQMEFPLDRLTTGRPFELLLSGQYEDGTVSAKGSARINFEPVG